METWQRKYVKENLPSLIQLTECSTQTKAMLVADGVLGDADVAKLDAVFKSGGKLEESSLLYSILQTRTNGYEKLLSAVQKCKQTGVESILLKGIQEFGIKSSEISFQGRELKFEDILHDLAWKDVESIFEQEAFKKEFNEYFVLKEKTLELFPQTIPNPPTFYIPRSMSNKLSLNVDIFKQDISDVFVVKGFSRSELTQLAYPNRTADSSAQLLEITTRFIFLDCDKDWDEIRQISSAPVHLINVSSNPAKYTLEDTYGGSDVLWQYVETESGEDRIYISETEFVEEIENDNKAGVCICDTPGMGKSWLLASIARMVQERHPERLMAFVSLPRFLESFKIPLYDIPIEKSNVLPLILDHLSSCALSKTILKEAFKRNLIKLELFLDGFDEIAFDCVGWTKALIKAFCDHDDQIKVYVTSRPHMRRELENTLGVIAYDILPFNLDNQVECLVKSWQIRNPNCLGKRLKQFAMHCLENLKGTLTQQELDITGIPLQCYLLAEVFMKEARLYAERGRKRQNMMLHPITVYEMYRKLIEMRLGVDTKTDPLSANIKNYHTWRALKIICPTLADDYARDVNLEIDNPDLNIFSFGLLEMRMHVHMTTAEFVHRTFAEFLVAEFFVDRMLTQHCTGDNTYVFSEKTVKLFAKQLVENCERVASSRYEKGSAGQVHHFDLYRFRDPSLIYFVDSQLQQCSFASISKVIVESFYSLIQCPKIYEIIQSSVFESYVNFLRFLKESMKGINPEHLRDVEKYFLSETIKLDMENSKVDLFSKPSWLLMCVAATYSNVAAIDECFKLYREIFQVDLAEECKQMKDGIHTPLHRAILRNNYEMVEYLLNKFPLGGQDYLSQCVERSYGCSRQDLTNKLEICKLLLSMKKDLLFEESESGHGPIVKKGIHLELLKLMVNEGADIRASDGINNIVHLAAEYMTATDFHELCAFLVQECKAGDLFKPNEKKWLSPMHHILKNSISFEILPETIEMIFNIPGMDTNELDDSEQNLLQSAVMGNHDMTVIRQLVKLGANFKHKHEYGKTILHMTAEKGDKEKTGYFLSLGLSINERDKNGHTPLNAIVCKDLEMAKYLVLQGADVYIPDRYGNTVAHSAIWMPTEDFHQFVLFFIKNCNTVNIFKTRNNQGETPLHAYLKYRKMSDDTLQLILNFSGLDVHDKDNEGNNLLLCAVIGNQNTATLNILISHGVSYTVENEAENNALYLAITKGNLAAVKYFYSLGLSLGSQEEGGIPLYLVSGEDCAKLVKYLITKGADVLATDNDKNNVAHTAAKNKKLSQVHFRDLVLLLLEHELAGHIFTARNKSMRTPLHERLYTGEMDGDTLLLLLKVSGMEINAEDKNGDTMLHSVLAKLEAFSSFRIKSKASKDTLQKIKMLAEHGADCQQRNKSGRSMLHIVAEKGLIELVDYFLSLGLDINEPDTKGNTPLLLAYKYREVIKYLVAEEADVTLVGQDGNTIAHKISEHHLNDRDEYHELITLLMDTSGSSELFRKQNSRGHTALQLRLLWKRDITHTTFEMLLDTIGDAINLTDKKGYNLFLTSIETDQTLAKITSLIQRGANYRAKNKQGQDALHLAAANGNVDVILHLLSLGMDFKTLDANGDTFLHIVSSRYYGRGSYHDLINFFTLRDQTDIFKIRNADGMLPIHLAAWSIDISEATMKLFYEAGVDFNSTCVDGNSLLIYGATGKKSLKFLTTLIKMGVNVMTQNSTGNTFAHYVATYYTPHQFHELVEYLLSNGFEGVLKVKNENMATSIQHAFRCIELLPETLDILFSNGNPDTDEIGGLEEASGGLDINGRDVLGEGVLHWALRGKRSLNFVKHLVKLGADWKARSDHGSNLAHISASFGSIEHLKYFVELGCDVNKVDNDGDNALHCVVHDANEAFVFEVANFLITNGVDKTCLNGEGKSAYMMAQERGIVNKRILNILC